MKKQMRKLEKRFMGREQRKNGADVSDREGEKKSSVVE